MTPHDHPQARAYRQLTQEIRTTVGPFLLDPVVPRAFRQVILLELADPYLWGIRQGLEAVLGVDGAREFSDVCLFLFGIEVWLHALHGDDEYVPSAACALASWQLFGRRR